MKTPNNTKVSLCTIASMLVVIGMGIVCIVAIIVGDKYTQYKAIMTLMCLGPMGAIMVLDDIEDIKKRG